MAYGNLGVRKRECPSNLTKSFFRKREARVELTSSRVSRELERGCPPERFMYWNLLYESIFRVRLPAGCEIVVFADDTALIVKAREFKTLKENGNADLGLLEQWARDGKLDFNIGKTEALLFGKKLGQQRSTFQNRTRKNLLQRQY